VVRVRLVVLAAVIAAVSAAAVVLAATTSSASRPNRAQEQAFEHAVVPLVTEGGRVVEQGMKPALHDLTTDHVTPSSFIAVEASQWQSTLDRVRTGLAGVRTVGQLRLARSRLVAALGLYAEAAADFRAAALTSGNRQRQLIDSGIATAKRGDATYDEGATIVQALRRSLGLGPSASFPDPGHE
jgi:hypothetical protein